MSLLLFSFAVVVLVLVVATDTVIVYRCCFCLLSSFLAIVVVCFVYCCGFILFRLLVAAFAAFAALAAFAAFSAVVAVVAVVAVAVIAAVVVCFIAEKDNSKNNINSCCFVLLLSFTGCFFFDSTTAVVDKTVGNNSCLTIVMTNWFWATQQNSNYLLQQQ